MSVKFVPVTFLLLCVLALSCKKDEVEAQGWTSSEGINNNIQGYTAPPTVPKADEPVVRPVITAEEAYNPDELSEGDAVVGETIEPECPQDDVLGETTRDIIGASIEAADSILREDQKGVVRKLLENEVPYDPLMKMMKYFNENESEFKNKNYMTLVDYSQNSKEKRMYIMDMRTGEVQREYTSHGNGGDTWRGDPDRDGMLDHCTHEDGSRRNLTRPGFLRVAEPYVSTRWGYGDMIGKQNGLRMDGLEDRNDDVRDRAVVMHEANFNFDYPMRQGWSWGCPSVPRGRMKHIIPKLQGGSLLYGHAPQCEE